MNKVAVLPDDAPHILLVDDDSRIRSMLSRYLGQHGYRVTTAEHAASARQRIEAFAFDLMIVDVMMPGENGFDLTSWIRTGSSVPILMLTARGDPDDRIKGLEIGADDYLPKPFNPRELLARLRAVLRRRSAPSEQDNQTLRFGRLAIDRGSRSARIDGEERPLTSHQFDILLALADNAGRVLNRERLMDLVKGEELDVFDRSIDVHISRIRAAIEDDAKHPRRILTVRGAGYVFAKRQDAD